MSALATVATVIFIGGTGAGMNLPIENVGGSPADIVSPFVAADGPIVVADYDGAPWANPQAAVPGLSPVVAGSSGPTVIVGLSKGAQVATGLESQDTRTNTRYVFIGDPDDTHGISRTFGMSPAPVPYTHNVDIVVAEYDGVGDFPDRPNLLSVANALAGWVYVHPNYGTGAANDPLIHLNEGTTTTTPNPNGTTTTHTVIPAANLPLTQPLRDLGLNTADLDKALRPVIDASYSRNQAAAKTHKPAPHKSTKGKDHHAKPSKKGNRA